MASAKLTALSARGTVLTGDLLYMVPAAGSAEYKGTAAGLAAFVAANGITLAGVPGLLSATTPTQIVDAQAGVRIDINASNAVAGSSNAGAAAGGGVFLLGGNAQRLTSGDAQGGAVQGTTGDGIGAGAGGTWGIYGGTGGTTGLGGKIDIQAGFGGSSGGGGSIEMLAGWGGGTAGDGGNIAMIAGKARANNDDGGYVLLEPGLKHGSGVDGKVIIRQPGGTPGTDEGHLYHDGTQFILTSPDGPVTIRAGTDAAGLEGAKISPTATGGLLTMVVDKTVAPAAVETAVFTVPAGSVIRLVQANVETALTGGGTTVTWSLGTAADPDKYGTAGSPTAADSLAQNSKDNWVPIPAQLTSAEPIVLTGTATGGATDGDTALTVGTVRVVIVYDTYQSLANA